MPQDLPPPVTDPAVLVQGILLFVAAGVVMVLGALLMGALVRRRMPQGAKGLTYECGELPFGESWVQFDLRFYVVALVFVIFDVSVALFYPWAVVFREAGVAGLLPLFFFFGVLTVGYVFLWRFGYLDWVRSAGGQKRPRPGAPADAVSARAST